VRTSHTRRSKKTDPGLHRRMADAEFAHIHRFLEILNDPNTSPEEWRETALALARPGGGLPEWRHRTTGERDLELEGQWAASTAVLIDPKVPETAKREMAAVLWDFIVRTGEARKQKAGGGHV
jgi:hypothetical protein